MTGRKAPPGKITIKEASELEIQDIKGNTVKFGTLFATQKAIVVFVRQFFCATCHAYVEQLSKITKEDLHAANTTIIIIGCGEWQVIQPYAEITKFTGPIYTDPTRKLYHMLGMTIETTSRTPWGQTRRSYATQTLFGVIMRSIGRGFMAYPHLMGKQGNMGQLGGDFILGPGNECSFASRMQHTEDHVEVADLMKAAEVSSSDSDQETEETNSKCPQ